MPDPLLGTASAPARAEPLVWQKMLRAGRNLGSCALKWGGVAGLKEHRVGTPDII